MSRSIHDMIPLLPVCRFAGFLRSQPARELSPQLFFPNAAEFKAWVLFAAAKEIPGKSNNERRLTVLHPPPPSPSTLIRGESVESDFE